MTDQTRNRIEIILAFITVLILTTTVYFNSQENDRHKKAMDREEIRHNKVMEQQDEQFKARMGFDYMVHQEVLADK